MAIEQLTFGDPSVTITSAELHCIFTSLTNEFKVDNIASLLCVTSTTVGALQYFVEIKYNTTDPKTWKELKDEAHITLEDILDNSVDFPRDESKFREKKQIVEICEKAMTWFSEDQFRVILFEGKWHTEPNPPPGWQHVWMKVRSSKEKSRIVL